MTPAARLRMAAEKLRELSARVDRGRYSWDAVAGFVVDGYSDADLEAANRLIAAMGPTVGAAVAAWLEVASKAWFLPGAPGSEAALAVADAILGAEVEG